MRHWFPRAARAALGVALCGVAALLASVYSANYSWRGFVPIAFVFVIVLLAARYGMIVALLSAATTALVFAYFLFPPFRDFRVASNAERSNIAWMLLGSIAISYLVSARPEQHDRK